MKKYKIDLNGIYEFIINLIFPQVCGKCNKVCRSSICNKCNLDLNKIKEFKVIDSRYDDSINNFSELIYVFKYEEIIRKLILDFKFNDKPYIGKTFVDFILKDKKTVENIKKYDTIIPVPISKKRKKQRGYNQSYIIANEIAKKTKLKILNNCLVKTKNIVEQSSLNKKDRKKNISNVYSLKNALYLKDKKILLIDDIYTTGSTVNECCKELLKGKPKKIGVLVLAKD